MVVLPISGREIPIIADDYAEQEFGSGAVKITPAHDPNDFEVGRRHNLPQVLVMDETGTMNENAGPYNGLDRFECRKQLVADLRESGVLLLIEDHVHQRYYPTAVLVTGYDIIYFWVARMIFTALEFTEQIPFKDVLIHGLVRDAEGRKMSKSLGNGIDPLEIIEQYGADAMRFMISTGSTPGQDLRFRLEKVEQARNFANKIWNASRFALMNLEGFQAADIDLTGKLGTSDRWILHRLNETVVRITRLLDSYEFGETGRLLYDFIWDDLCDWYIEFSKLSLYSTDAEAKRSTQSVLAYVLDQTQRMIHPFMPFISEEIWQHLPHEGETISLAAWPVFKPEFVADDAVREMEQLMEVIRAVRNIRAEVNVPMSKKIELLLKPGSPEIEAIYQKNTEYIRRFCNTSQLEINSQLVSPEKAMTAIVTGVELFLPLAGLIDISQEIIRLDKELQSLHGEVERIEKKLGNEGFVAKAPVKVIDEEKAKLADYADKRDKVIARLAELKG
ncbi:unnamed protein product [Aphanomyces euteiches]